MCLSHSLSSVCLNLFWIDCQVCQLSAQKTVQEDLVDRLNTIAERLGSLRVENEEVEHEEELLH